MFCIGLTGSTASGKSTVAHCFKQLGIDVINADQIAKSLVQPQQPAYQQIVHHFGQSVLTEDGQLNRRYLRDIIVNNVEARLWLENLLHPLIRDNIQQTITTCSSPYCIIEIPLLTDKSTYWYLNRILLVLADPEEQITRVMARDHCSREQACALLAISEACDAKRKQLADDILINDKTIDILKAQIHALHLQYLYEASTSSSR